MLKQLSEGGELKIAACYPRAVQLALRGRRAPLPEEGVEVLNMRVETGRAGGLRAAG